MFEITTTAVDCGGGYNRYNSYTMGPANRFVAKLSTARYLVYLFFKQHCDYWGIFLERLKKG